VSFLRKRHYAHPSKKNTVSTFHGPDAPECAT
jgi:hypothetical protein